MAAGLGFHQPTVFLLPTATLNHARKSTPPADAKAIDFCTEAEYGEEIINKLKSRVNTGTATLRTLADDAATCKPATTRYAHQPEGLAFETLAALAQPRLKLQAQTIKDAIQVQVNAITLLSKRKAELPTLYAADAATHTAGTTGEATTDSHSVTEQQSAKHSGSSNTHVP
ncbi:uncharacterized protein TEOVI_000810100 [Trypanosoma equiperdum]|uniref:Trypanosome variant surface glycoprotein (A-type) n=1 Tax=Trypanosoma equiperdum TaxID=5694 RepID=A0A1G4IKG7_TRYEQ|nr:hypothetical protein TEOVI_000810100 [Trypanosoma equiperdum]